MRYEFFRRGAERDHLVRQQVRLDGRDAVPFDTFHRVQRRDQLQEGFPRRAAEIADIDPCQHDLLHAARRNLFRLADQLGRRYVAAGPARVRDRTVRTTVVAAVLHFEKGPRAVAGRESGEERTYLLGGACVHFEPSFAPPQHRSHLCVERSLFVIADHDVHPFDGRQVLRAELGVTPRYGYQCAGILAYRPPHDVAAFFVCVFGHRTGVDHADVRPLSFRGTGIAAFFELAGDGCGLGKVEFAA